MKKISLAVLSSVILGGYANADVNVRIDPIQTLGGVANLQMDFPISERWTLGPALSYINRKIDSFEAQAYVVGIRGNYWFSGNVFTQGWYVGPSVSYMNVKVEDDDDVFGKMKGEASGVAAAAMFGYQWMWESFNMMLGAGPVYYTVGKVTVENDANGQEEDFEGFDGGGLGLEFSLGWKF